MDSSASAALAAPSVVSGKTVVAAASKPRDFGDALRQETLQSERTRATLVAGLLAVIGVTILGVHLLLPGKVKELFHGYLPLGETTTVFAVAITYELAMRRVLLRFIEEDRELPARIRYLNALIETSLPTAGMYLMARAHAPVYAVFGAHTFAYFLFILLSTLRLDFKLSLFTGCVAAVEYIAGVLQYLKTTEHAPLDVQLTSAAHHVGKCFVLVLAGVTAGFVASELRRRAAATYRSIEERNRVVDLFGRHVSPAVVDKLLAQPYGEVSETRNVCVMFLDIRNFTTYSESRTPDEVVRFLNTLFDPMIDAVNRNHGIINKFLGDGFMAVFGAPIDDGRASANAVRAAQEILAEVQRLERAGAIGPTRVGIGLHSGRAITGNVGSSSRKEYTIIGDVVNLASRIEGLNKQFESQLLVSGEVHADVPGIAGQSRGPVSVKGRAHPVEIYQLA